MEAAAERMGVDTGAVKTMQYLRRNMGRLHSCSLFPAGRNYCCSTDRRIMLLPNWPSRSAVVPPSARPTTWSPWWLASR
jgi:hypothetical protein